MEQKKFGVAIIGYGGMGTWHTQELQTMEELTLCGVYDILPERNAAAEQAGLHAYASREELLQDPNVQLVTVAIPNDLHHDVCIDCMKHGKNVISEKPVCLNHQELQEMIDASKEYGVLFTVHQNRRWDEDYLIMKKLYDEGTLGRVFNIESRVHGSRGIPGDWRNQKEHGGGMVLDWGVHLLDQILMMVDKPLRSVYADLSHVTNEAVDDGFKALLHFDDDLTVQVEVGTSNFISLPRWYMQGENGTAVIDDWDLSGKIVMVSDWENRDAVPVVTAAGLTKTMAPRTDETIETYPLPKVQSDVRDFYRNVIKACRGEEEQLIRHDQVMNVMKLMEAIFRSGETGQTVIF
ncbi:MAG TPA: Gfo/Idh/MocA family oxidoreductase [Firmicutes bacterium]|nr:Gfo/Idh/MocA family oxidoreductase [Bacillota bacterium]